MRINISPGDKHGMLTIIKEVDRKVLPCGQINRAFLCKCDCGNMTTVRIAHLVRDKIKSCGCLRGEKHKMCDTNLYGIWRSMKERTVRNKNNNANGAHNYRRKGIKICEEWEHSFLAFKKWAINNGYERGLQIDRIDNDGNYDPSNCRFVKNIINANNKDNTLYVVYKNNRYALSLLLLKLNKYQHYNAIRNRLVRGWSVERALDTPVRKGNYKKTIKYYNRIKFQNSVSLKKLENEIHQH